MNETEELRVSVAILGARMHYAVPRIFSRAGILEKFFTDIYIGNKNLSRKIIQLVPSTCRPRSIERLIGRNEPQIPTNKIVSFDLFGLWYWWKRNNLQNNTDITHFFAESGRIFNNLVIKKGLGNTHMIYGCNGASLEMFESAKERGIYCILEQTIAPRKIEKDLLVEECNSWPGWQQEPLLPFDDDPLVHREQEEWVLADTIVCGSEFVRESLQTFGIEKEKCKVVPYGVDLSRFHLSKKSPLSGRKLHVLFAGEVGLRKGIPYLMKAIEKVGVEHIDVKIAGQILIERNIIDSTGSNVEWLGSVPRTRMTDLYSWADVFILPSICEGSATVTYEALASGVPVIATPNSGSLVTDDLDGYITPVRSFDAIASHLEGYLATPSLLAAQQGAAYENRWKCGLEAYSERLLNALETLN